MTLCVSGIVRAVHQSSSKLGDTPLARLDLFESLPSRRFGCRASTTNSTTKSRSTSLYNGGASSRGGCRALQLYSAPERSTSLQLYSALHSTSSTPSLRLPHTLSGRTHHSRPRSPCHPPQHPRCQGTNHSKRTQTGNSKQTQTSDRGQRVRLKDCSASSNLAGREARTRPCVGSCEASMDTLLSGYPPTASPNSHSSG